MGGICWYIALLYELLTSYLAYSIYKSILCYIVYILARQSIAFYLRAFLRFSPIFRLLFIFLLCFSFPLSLSSPLFVMSLSYFPLSSRSLLSLCSYKVFLHGKFISLFYIYIRWHSYSWSPASHFGFVALCLLIILWLWWRIQCDQYMSVKPLLPPSVRIYWTNPL